jgi:hypothetical protein
LRHAFFECGAHLIHSSRIAHPVAQAGIPIFVTGGIGGVHRGAEATMDVSADLSELGRTPVAVVCAGIKSILDIPKTLEVLETQGVAVVALGTDEFPAFFTPASGCAAPLRVDTPAQVAQMIDASRRLRLDSGMVIAVPIPASQAADAAPLQLAQDQAIAESVAQKVGGRDVTPFLLARVNELTHGKSLVANIALIKNNAKVGAQIAASFAAIARANLSAEIAAKRPQSVLTGSHVVRPCTLSNMSDSQSRDSTCVFCQTRAFLAQSSVRAAPVSASSAAASPARVCVIGGNALDLLARPLPGQQLLQFTSNPGTVVRQWGGQ